MASTPVFMASPAVFLVTLKALKKQVQSFTAQNTTPTEINAAIDILSSMTKHFDAVAKAPKPPNIVRINELRERFNELNAAIHSIGVDTKNVKDGSIIAQVYFHKTTPPGTMCSKQYIVTKETLEKNIKDGEASLIGKREALAKLNEIDALKQSFGSQFSPVRNGTSQVGHFEQQILQQEQQIASYKLSLNNHLTTLRPINSKRFRAQFEDLFNERMDVLAELRTLEAELTDSA